MIATRCHNSTGEMSLRGSESFLHYSLLSKFGNEFKFRTGGNKKAMQLGKFRSGVEGLVRSQQSACISTISASLPKLLSNPKLSASVLEICLKQDIPVVLLDMLSTADFEGKKEIVNIFVVLMEFKGAAESELMEAYLREKASTILVKILGTFTQDELALHGGTLFRSCLLHHSMDQAVLDNVDLMLDRLLPNLKSKSFDIVSDAFLSFSRLLDTLRRIQPRFFAENYAVVYPYLKDLLQSKEYVTQRQSLTLLRTVLFERINYEFMEQFINERENLVIVMKLLADRSVTIRWGAYHVFKVFAANPKKSVAVEKLLLRNRSKLIAFLKENITFTELRLELELKSVINSLNNIQVAE